MYPTQGSALGQYRAVNAYGAAGADQLQLVLHLMDGAIERIHLARSHLLRNEVAAKGETIGKAIGIIDGLRCALDMERGGKIAASLESLYDYMMRRLLEANLHNDPERLNEVAGLLGEIRSGWSQMTREQANAASAGHEPAGA